VLPPCEVERIDAHVQKSTRVRLSGQVRPSSYETEMHQARYAVEFVGGPFGDVELLTQLKMPAPAA
jgi:single-stranded DNA-binding protein